MNAAAEPTTTVTIRVPLSLRSELDALAEAMGRNRQYVGIEALRGYAADESWQVGQILEGSRAADAGDLATGEELEAVIGKYGALAG